MPASPRVTACTIIAKNYLPYARVLARSFQRHSPAGRFVVLIVDSVEGSRHASEPFETLTFADLPLDDARKETMAAVYDVMELATAFKPTLLKLLLAQGAPSVIFFDPDIELFADPVRFATLAETHGLVLTPHILRPIARTQGWPSNEGLLRVGMFNLGFVAVGPTGAPFLDFIEAQLQWHAISAPEQSLFTDQKWFDFAPSFVAAHIVRETSANVAYWNLFQRQLSFADGFFVDGSPLEFFHFSGFSPEEPHLLSRHELNQPRTLLSEQPALARLCRAYASHLLEQGWEQAQETSYRWGHLANGWLLDRERRRGLRSLFLQTGAAPLRLFTHAGCRELEELHASLEVSPRASPSIVRHHFDFGVNVVGYFKAELGVGEAGRRLLSTVEAAGIPYALRTSERTGNRQQHPFYATESSDLPFAINLMSVNADQTLQVMEDVGREWFAGRYNIGLWFWETDVFPLYVRDAAAALDEIWVTNEFTAQHLRLVIDKPVFVFPLPTRPAPPTFSTRADLGIDEAFLFANVFDYHSVVGRKNPFGLISAFKSAFKANESVQLVIKTINGAHDVRLRERLRLTVATDSRIHLIETYWSAAQMRAFIQHCDCLVSLHRAEGFGLSLADAMACAKPVIATGYSGNMSFMTQVNSFLTPYEEVRIGPGQGPYPAEGKWAEPDLRAAAELMRQVFANPVLARLRGEHAKRTIAETHGMKAAVAYLRRRLDTIQGQAIGESA